MPSDDIFKNLWSWDKSERKVITLQSSFQANVLGHDVPMIGEERQCWSLQKIGIATIDS